MHSALLAALLVVVGLPHRAAAEGLDDETLQRAQVEALRHDAANHLHLQAFELLDELVFGWTKHPPFPADTPVVIADITVPLGFGSGLEALIENHFADLVIQHKETHVLLSHCPACRAVTVESTAAGTVISHGIDQPGVLRRLGAAAGAKRALFLDFEAEGKALVLRARLTSFDDDLTIVHARTLSTSTSSAALLRSGDHLVSADEARAEYLVALQQRGPLIIPVRLSLVQFAAPPEGTGGTSTVPIVWLQTGAELGISHARDWMGSLIVGGTFVPQVYAGLMVEARVNRLLTGATASLTHPNLYGFVGTSVSTLTGPLAVQLRDGLPNITDLIAAATGATSATTIWPSFNLGLDLRIGSRVGASVFVQTTPTLAGSGSIGRYLDFGVQIHAVGGEVSLCF